MAAQQGGGAGQDRPEVMDSLTESQLRELEFQFDEGDRDEFDTVATSYGWPADIAQQVWTWLESGGRATGPGGGTGE